MCEAPIKTVGTTFKPVIPNKTNNNKPDRQPEWEWVLPSTTTPSGHPWPERGLRSKSSK